MPGRRRRAGNGRVASPRLALAIVVAAALLVAGCGLLDGLRGSREAQDIPEPRTEGQVLSDHLAFLEAFTAARPEEQASVLEAARQAAATRPTAENRLRYALLLADPGTASHDPGAASAALESLLGHPDLLRPAERTLARLLLDETSAHARLRRENAEIVLQAAKGEKEREQALNRRIQAQAAEIESLRRAVEDAEAKLRAVAELEKSLTERQAPPKGPPP